MAKSSFYQSSTELTELPAPTPATPDTENNAPSSFYRDSLDYVEVAASGTSAAESAAEAAASAATAVASAVAAASSAAAADVSAGDADADASAAAASAAAAAASESAAATSATNAATSEANAAASAASALASKNAAATSETNAATSATNAATSETNAAASATAAAASYDSFDDRYLGPKASVPTLDNDGNALLTGALYFNTTSNTLFVWNGSSWASTTGGGAVTSVFTRTGAVTAQSGDYTGTQITNTPAGNIAATTVQAALNELDTEKAPLASPALTGTPTAPTAAVDTNTTQLATTAYVIGQASAVADGTPAIDGTAARGTSNHYARADHVHPTDTSRAPLASPTLTGTPAAPTAAVDTNTTQIATTAFVIGQASAVADGTPAMDGTAARGTSNHYARADHVHPTDTSRAPLASPALTGTPTAPTAAAGTNTTQVATTAFVVSLNKISKVVIQKFTASGTYTPTANMVYCIIECLGGGGGGGGCASTNAGVCQGSGGGGAGGYSRALKTAAQVGASQAVTIGSAGTGGAAGFNTGGSGGDTSVGVLCVGKGASGGLGGFASSNVAVGGAGGVAGTGDVTTPGAPGITIVGPQPCPAGTGGSSAFGGGGLPPNSFNSAGANATGFGSGGSGAIANNAGGAWAGGNGTAGLVIITEYCTA